MVLTHPQPACGRPLEEVVAECVRAGATAIQLRDKTAGSRALFAAATRLLAITAPAGVPLVVNDRLDVSLAAGADGVHLGPNDLPVGAARTLAPPGFLIGYSTDDPDEARRARAAGADYLGVGAVFGTRSKPGLADEAIGPDRVRAVLDASRLPCLGIGGITPDNAASVYATGAGVAVLSAVMSAPDPARVVRDLLRLAR
ncbi:thiamine phosphate synthase [Candidatus Palauibacter sp.]|uniref:thiamine phosphate synthase n=1 Tax=Candidatus Palauibacter sp. TaxID=3101350 RepID=UPI003B0250B8